MALDDAGLSSAMDALFGGIHDSPTAKDDFASALKNYAASATLSVPSTGLSDPNGVGLTGSTSATPSFDDASLDTACGTLFSGSRTRAEAAQAVTDTISNYAITITCTGIGPGALVGSQGPVTGSASASSPTFDTATLTSSVAAIFAQDNSAAFAGAALAAAIKTFFKSGRMVVAATGYLAPMAVTHTPAPCTGSATGSIT